MSFRIVYLVVTAAPFHAFRVPLKAPTEGFQVSNLNQPQPCRTWSLDRTHLLHRDGLGQIPRKINIEPFAHSEPVCNELERDDVE